MIHRIVCIIYDFCWVVNLVTCGQGGAADEAAADEWAAVRHHSA